MSELEFVRAVRRDLHAHPELAREEHRTAESIESWLREAGWHSRRVAGTSVVAETGSGDAPTLAFRADIDAVPVQEATSADYASTVPGVMHACGHDGHTATLLLLARRLAARPAPRPILLVFQAAEEAFPSGAPTVVEALAGMRSFDAVYAAHVWPELPAGVVGVTEGPVMASVAGILITVEGKPAVTHGENAESGGVDALAVGAELYRELHCGDSGRRLDAMRSSALHVGRFTGGEHPQNSPLRCRLEGTLRALSATDEERAVNRLRRLAQGVAARHGADVDVAVTQGIRPALVNHLGPVAAVRDACAARGVDTVHYPQSVLGISDDFGWYAGVADARIAMFLLGTRREGAPGPTPNLHDPAFDFDEWVLVRAADVFEQIARDSSGVGPTAR